MKKQKAQIQKIVKEYKDATQYEIWENVLVNFTFGFIGATIVVFIATRTDMAVLLGYITYYYFMGKIVNRPKYVTDFGKLIVFPFPSAIGAFVGYKLSYVLLELISKFKTHILKLSRNGTLPKKEVEEILSELM